MSKKSTSYILHTIYNIIYVYSMIWHLLVWNTIMSVDFARLRSFYALIILLFLHRWCITLICKSTLHIVFLLCYPLIYYHKNIAGFFFCFEKVLAFWITWYIMHILYALNILFSLFFHAHAIYQFSDLNGYVIVFI